MELVGDFGPEAEQFLRDVQVALKGSPRRLPSQYLYDATGSLLFDRICDLDEYYLTRAELAILSCKGREICDALGPECALIEFGSGSSMKTRVLLDQLADPVAYVPVDISREHLQKAASRLSEQFTDLEILPVCADYTRPFDLPKTDSDSSRKVVYFSGSTIGNMPPAAAARLMDQLRRVAAPQGGVLIGVDLHKDTRTLEAAYDDSEGVTAEFELNLLTRINRELGANFDLRAWEYEARYDAELRRVEMYVRSRQEQEVRVGDLAFRFQEGERVLTEVSQKYTFGDFASLAGTSGLQVVRVWTDPLDQYSLQYLEPV